MKKYQWGKGYCFIWGVDKDSPLMRQYLSRDLKGVRG
jgi:hypothetical protein